MSETPAEAGDAPAADQAPLYATPDNPVPERARAGWLRTRDGKRLRYALFPALGRPLAGTVIILAGRNECIEKYFETIADLSDRGLGVAMIDWRGQGASERLLRDPQRGFVESFRDHVDDLDLFFSTIALPDCPGPFFFLGHSMGGLIGLLAAPVFVNRIRRMVLSAPLLAFEGLPLSMANLRRATGIARAFGLSSVYAAGGPRPKIAKPFAENVLTSDYARWRRNTILYEKHPQLALGGPTIGWMHAACVATETVLDPDFAATIHIPTLFVAAGADTVVSTAAIEAYSRRIRAGALLTIDGARHELLQEADIYREQALAAFGGFVPGTDG